MEITKVANPEWTLPFLSPEALGGLGVLDNPIHIYCFETQRVCWANKSGLAMWNAASLEELRQRVLTPFSPATNARLEEYRHAFRRGERRMESWTIFPKGVPTPVPCCMKGVSLDGHPEAMLVEALADYTDYISPAELRSLEALRHTPLMISLFSESGAVLMRNPAATSCFAEMDRAQPENADHFAAMFASESDHATFHDVAEAGVPIRRDAVMSLPAGPVHTLHVTLLSDPVTGELARLVAQEDISDIIAVQRQLAASEDALDAVLTINLVPILVLSASDNTILTANLSAQERVGKALVPGAKATDIFIQPEDCANLREIVLAGQGGAMKAQLRSADGIGFWASLTGIRISFEKQDALAVLVTDIDNLHRTTEDLETALTVERTTAQMQRRFLAIASHEFRTPLAVIDSIAQRLARSAETMTPDQIRGRVQRIRGTVHRLLQLLETIIDRARENRTALGYVGTDADLGALISSVAADFRENHPAVEVEVRLPAMPLLRIDAALMQQVLANLLLNAEKYTALPPRVLITGEVTSEDVQIFIRDWGIGIPEEERSRVFSDYVRGSNVGSRPGTGLGLAIVSQIMAMHGGLIEVLETDGPGTTMKMTFPRP